MMMMMMTLKIHSFLFVRSIESIFVGMEDYDGYDSSHLLDVSWFGPRDIVSDRRR